MKRFPFRRRSAAPRVSSSHDDAMKSVERQDAKNAKVKRAKLCSPDLAL
jgi:hypothetical protein